MTCYNSVTLIQVKGIYMYVRIVSLIYRKHMIRSCVVTVRPSCHNVRTLRHIRNLVTSVYPLRQCKSGAL